MTTEFGSWRLPEGAFSRVMQGAAADGTDGVSARLLGAARLGARPLRAYGGIHEVWPAVGPLDGAVPAVAEALLHVILDPIDDALQAMYRSCLAPLNTHLSACERLQALEAVRPDAFALVGRYDWEWLGWWFRAAGGTSTWALRRLSHRAFPIRRVTIRFTYHCNIACRHCYNDSGPDKRHDRLSWDGMADVIADAGRLGIPELTLTGGEPLLYVEDVLRAVRHARQHGVRAIRIFTNGFWARTPGDAHRMLTGLADAGFGASAGDGLKVSAGAYHQEHLRAEVVANAAAAHWDVLGRPLSIDIETDQAGRGAEGIRQALDGLAAGIPVQMHTRDVVGSGRGGDIMTVLHEGGDAPCRSIDQITFDPDGSCRPCCGFNAGNAGVRVGRLGSDRLPTLIKRMQNDALLQYIARTPLRQLHTLTATALPASKRPCELCQAAVGDLADREPVLRQLAPQQQFYPFWFAPEDQ